MKTKFAAGFTAVEITVTLFIGSLLLMGGYQAYTLVLANTKDTRERTIASSYGYEALRRLGNQYAKYPCTAKSEANMPSGILPAQPAITVNSARYSVSCPYGANSVSKVITKINYGSPAKEVVHAIYMRGS